MSEEIRVRDIRNPGWFWTPNEVIKVYGPTIGAYGVAVYSVLAQCSFSGHSKTTMRQISLLLDISPQTVMRSIEKLIKAKLIKETKKSLSPAQGPSEYDLLPVPIGNGGIESVPVVSAAVPIGNGSVPIGNTNKTIYNTKQDSNLTPSEDLFGNKKEPEGKPKKSDSPKEKTSDPRHHPVSVAITAAYDLKNEVKLRWNGREAKKLSEFLADHPHWTFAEICKCVNNRFNSDENHAEEPHEWITRLAKYASGPLNAYGKPKVNGSTPLSHQNGSGRTFSGGEMFHTADENQRLRNENEVKLAKRREAMNI